MAKKEVNKIYQHYRLDPKHIKFIEEQAEKQRRHKVTIVELALEEYAKKVGYELSK